jgi:hypothetical protein
MSAPLCFIDTEATGVHPDRRVWEVAVIRRDESGEQEHVWQVSDVDLSNADPFGLNVGRFYDRHALYGAFGEIDLLPERAVAARVEEATRGAHLVGAVPSFDAGCLDPMLRRHGLIPAWHYHLVDVEAMAVGYLEAMRLYGVGENGMDAEPVRPPWRSDALSRACGVAPPSDDERHTALGDARWAQRWYDAMTGGVS